MAAPELVPFSACLATPISASLEICHHDPRSGASPNGFLVYSVEQRSGVAKWQRIRVLRGSADGGAVVRGVHTAPPMPRAPDTHRPLPRHGPSHPPRQLRFTGSTAVRGIDAHAERASTKAPRLCGRAPWDRAPSVPFGTVNSGQHGYRRITERSREKGRFRRSDTL